MQIRAIFLSTIKRINEINHLYKTEIPLTYVSRLLVLVTDLSDSALKLIQQKLKNPSSGLAVFPTNNQNDFYLSSTTSQSWPDDLLQVIPELKNSDRVSDKPIWKLRNSILDFNNGPLIMGILNVTPDSFSDGGSFSEKTQAVDHALKMAEEGVHIIDIGGESTRPGSDPVSTEQELERVIPVIEEIRKYSAVPVSVDTYKSRVARAALEAGADLINDISGARFDEQMVNVACSFDCPIIIMHIKGTPKDMQQNPTYTDVMAELYTYFTERITYLNQAGVHKIVLDPGIGFGKRTEDNLHILRDLRDLKYLKNPLLIGLSRKSFIGQILDQPVERRLSGSLGANLAAIINGASILRVHDVKETKDLLDIYFAIRNS